MTKSTTVQLNKVALEPGKPGFLVRLILNRPEAANAFNSEMADALVEALHSPLLKDEGCRALVLSGAGKHFCAGADLKEMGEMGRAPWEENLAQAQKIASIYSALRECPSPTLALVHGSCFGGGVGLVAAADGAVARSDARFCLSEVRVGAVAGVILPYLADKVAAGDLRRWVFQARTLSAEEAREVKLIQRIGGEDEVRDELTALLAGSPDAQRAFKQAHLKMIRHVSDEMPALLARMRGAKSGQEGIGAFLQKRSPSWKAVPPEMTWWPKLE